STATICSIEKRLCFMANHLLVQGQVCRKTRSRIGPGFLTQIIAPYSNAVLIELSDGKRQRFRMTNSVPG
ncbi:hypothetical protein, partial [Burkholderia gladioli]|uniref:hypothetical protein n=1 Tax=Burkholderia gladioli TaxID=28095 RepID=UPI001ABBA1AF